MPPFPLQLNFQGLNGVTVEFEDVEHEAKGTLSSKDGMRQQCSTGIDSSRRKGRV
jgi:hypothetical protein